jgi:hypothetical protein
VSDCDFSHDQRASPLPSLTQNRADKYEGNMLAQRKAPVWATLSGCKYNTTAVTAGCFAEKCTSRVG